MSASPMSVQTVYLLIFLWRSLSFLTNWVLLAAIKVSNRSKSSTHSGEEAFCCTLKKRFCFLSPQKRRRTLFCPIIARASRLTEPRQQRQQQSSSNGINNKTTKSNSNSSRHEKCEDRKSYLHKDDVVLSHNSKLMHRMTYCRRTPSQKSSRTWQLELQNIIYFFPKRSRPKVCIQPDLTRTRTLRV